MKKRTQYYIFSALTLLMTFVFSFYFIRYPYKKRENTVRVEGVITGHSSVNTRHGKRYDIHYTYTYDKRDYRGQAWVGGKTYNRYKKGDRIFLLVKQYDPAESFPADGDGINILRILLFFAALFSFFACFSFFIFAKLEKNGKPLKGN